MAKGSSSIWFCQFTWLLLGWLTEVQGLNCSVEPFSLGYKNVIVNTVPQVYASHRGILWLAGSQKTNMAVQIGTTLNSTFLPDVKVCAETLDSGCVAWRGGLFNTDESSSWVRDIGDVPFNGSVSNVGWDYLNADGYQNSHVGPLTRFPYGWDTVGFGDNLQIQGFPLTVIDDNNFPFGAGMIGLADQSTFLNQSVENDISPSKSWALDYGSIANNIDGEVIIGGYNPNKATWDTFTNFTVFPDKSKPCPLQINVTGIKWGGVDLMDGQDKFMACVEPAYWSTIMPLKVQQNFNKTMLQAQNIEFYAATWEYFYYNSTNNNTDFKGLPSGDFTIELDELIVTIPREEWIFQAVYIDNETGDWTNATGSIQTMVGTAGWPAGIDPKLAFLGGPFLSQVYLVVDYETGVFSLAPVTRPSASTQGLRKLGCDNKVAPTSSPSSGPAATVPGKKSNTGAIVGGVGGGAVLLGLIAGVIFFRRRRINEKLPVEVAVVPGLTKEQSEAQQMGFHQHPYDAPPAFSPTASPGPYSPPTSPGPYGSVGLSSAPMRRPLPGQGRYPQPGSPPQHYYDQQSYHTTSMASEPVELGGASVSELSAQPLAYSGTYDEGSVVSGQASGQASHK